MGSGGNAAGSGATPAGAVACTYGPQFIEGKPTGAQGRPRPEHRKRRASTARSASGNRYRKQRTVAGNCTGRQPGSRVRAHGKLCGRCRGGDMSTPQKCPSTGHYLRRLQITAVLNDSAVGLGSAGDHADLGDLRASSQAHRRPVASQVVHPGCLARLTSSGRLGRRRQIRWPHGRLVPLAGTALFPAAEDVFPS